MKINDIICWPWQAIAVVEKNDWQEAQEHNVMSRRLLVEGVYIQGLHAAFAAGAAVRVQC